MTTEAVTADELVSATPEPTREAALRRLLRSRSGLVGAIITALVVLVALAAQFGAFGYDAISQDASVRLQAPSGEHWLGTDQFGRDIFVRSAVAAANSLLIAVVAVGIATTVGTAGGVLAGYYRGVGSRSILGVTNVLFAFPPLLLALALAAVFAGNWFTVAVAIAIVYIPIFVRVTRGPVLSLRETNFVRAATVLGFSASRVLLRHILPNLVAIVIVQVTLSLSWAVLTEASLSYLGLGAPPPAPSLGSMVFDARSMVNAAWWTMAAPGALIIVMVVGLNLLGDGLRDALDPRHGERR